MENKKVGIIISVVVTGIVGIFLGGLAVFALQNSGGITGSERLRDSKNFPAYDKSKETEAELVDEKQDEKRNNQVALPIVAYSRNGLLNSTASGIAAEAKLEEKLIKPATDYYNESGVNVVAFYITVPQNIGGEYGIVEIYSNGGLHEYSFGKREQEYDYWKPDCMGPCTFSETFKKKYPEIVK